MFEHKDSSQHKPVTSASSKEQVEWMSFGSDTPVSRKRPRTRSVAKGVEENYATAVQQETSWRRSSILNLTDSPSNENRSEEVSFYDI